MHVREALPVVVPATTALLLVAIGWLTFGVDWAAILPDWYSLVLWGPPFQLATGAALLGVVYFAIHRDAFRGIGSLLVLVGVFSLVVSIGGVGCNHLNYGESATYGVTYDGDRLHFGDHTPGQDDYRCQADPVEAGLLVGYGLASIGSYLVLDPDRFERIRRPSSPLLDPE